MSLTKDRLAACQERLDDSDVLVLFPSQNLHYLTGFNEPAGERPFFLFVFGRTDGIFLVPDLYETQIREETSVSDVRPYGDDENPYDIVNQIANGIENQKGQLYLDDTMWAQFARELRTAFSKPDYRLASEVLSPLRSLKDETEIDALARAATITDEVVEEVRLLGEDVVGMTERDLADWIASKLESKGGNGVLSGPLVASGPNGAKPHHQHSERVIESGEPVVLDFGTRVDGYPSDQTRTLVFGRKPNDYIQEVHDIVREAQTRALEAVEPGVSAERIDQIARDHIDASGYGNEFIHRTGHGIGLDIHEKPYIVDGNSRKLESGMVFSVEPGIYLPGEFGVRIEDIVVVTDDGVDRLNQTSRGWHTSRNQ
ncbi:aminopeptidase P family protein [Natrialbaceae archaeon A-CW2]